MKTMTPSDRKSALVNFPGWGNPKNAIWFIGVEEAGEWTCQEFYKMRDERLNEVSLDEYCQRQYEIDLDTKIRESYTPNQDGNVYFGEFAEDEPLNRTHLGISKFFCNSIQSKIEPREYLKSYLCKTKDSINSFLTNLYPFGVRRINEESWTKVASEYRRVFELTQNSKSEYQEFMIEERIKVIEKLYSENKPKVIIAFGYSNGLDRRHLLLLKRILKNEEVSFEQNDWKRAANSKWHFIIKRFENLLYILVPHFCIDRTSQYSSLDTGNRIINIYEKVREAIE